MRLEADEYLFFQNSGYSRHPALIPNAGKGFLTSNPFSLQLAFSPSYSLKWLIIH
jgi:hypothetical protein